MPTPVVLLPLPSVGDGLAGWVGLGSAVAEGVGEGEGLVVLPALPEDAADASGLALVAHGAGDGVAVAVRVALGVTLGAGGVVVRLGLGSGSGLGVTVCAGVSGGLVGVSDGDPEVGVSEGEPEVGVPVAGLVVTVAGAVVGGVVVAAAVGLVVPFGWAAAPVGLHDAAADARAPGLGVTTPDPLPARWPGPPGAFPPPFEFWPVIAWVTDETSGPMAARTGGTASATPRANTAKPTAKAGRSNATCHRLAGCGARRAWPPWWARRRSRSARNPPRAGARRATGPGACA